MSDSLNGHPHNLSSETGESPLNIEKEKARILLEISRWFDKVRSRMDSAADSGEENPELRAMPREINSSLEELQHQALIIKAAEYFNLKLGELNWFWYCGEQGSSKKAHLCGKKGNSIIISADANPHLEVNKTAILKSLEKLDNLTGEKFYLIQSDEVFRFARQLLEEMDVKINILNLDKVAE